MISNTNIEHHASFLPGTDQVFEPVNLMYSNRRVAACYEVEQAGREREREREREGDRRNFRTTIFTSRPQIALGFSMH